MTGNRIDLIEYRLSQARDSIREADVCEEKERPCIHQTQ